MEAEKLHLTRNSTWESVVFVTYDGKKARQKDM